MNNNIKKLIKHKGGISALLTVIIISASGLIMARGAAYLSMGELDIGYNNCAGNSALSLADACLEEAMYRIKLNTSYTVSNDTLSLGGDSCIINSISINGNERTITTTGIKGSFTKQIEAIVQINGDYISLVKWEEI